MINSMNELNKIATSRKTVFFDASSVLGYAILATPVVIIILFIKFVLKKKAIRDLKPMNDALYPAAVQHRSDYRLIVKI